jgi:flagellar biosynthetic protein FlhB
MAEQDSERSEAATPFKLKKAHDRGQVPRSTDLVSAAVFGAGMVVLAGSGWQVFTSVLQAARRTLLEAGSAAAPGARLEMLLHGLLAQAGALVLPWLALLMAAAVAATLLQTGVVFSLEPLKLDLTRINPATGFKRLFSPRTLFDAGKACVKLAVLTVAVWLALQSLLPQFQHLAGLAPAAYAQALLGDVSGLGLKLALVLALVAVLDVVFTRREFAQRMRMSRREMKDEHKNREGDPRIRGRLRELRRELLKRSLALRNTRQADVVLTNPTHYAVALRYVHGEMAAPQVVAKGAGQLAAAMREIAYRHRIAVVQNPALTRRLFRQVGIEDALPPDFHAEVARIIVWVFAQRAQRQRAEQGAFA